MQSNLVTQGKANVKKLKEYKAGSLTLSQQEAEVLEGKVKFYLEYSGLARSQNHEKMMMLGSWAGDRTGKAWL